MTKKLGIFSTFRLLQASKGPIHEFYSRLMGHTLYGTTRANPFLLTRPYKLRDTRVSVITTSVLHGWNRYWPAHNLWACDGRIIDSCNDLVQLVLCEWGSSKSIGKIGSLRRWHPFNRYFFFFFFFSLSSGNKKMWEERMWGDIVGGGRILEINF